MLAALASDHDTEHGMLDATIVRAHPCAAGAQKNYAGAEFIAYLHAQGCEAVIPPHQRAKVKRAYDTCHYRERHLVECCFQ